MMLPYWLFLLLSLPVSACVGSFLGVVVYRLPRHLSFVAGRSYCESCQVPLRPLDMLPVLSFLARRGRCRSCGVPIRGGILGIELTTMAASAVVVWFSPSVVDLAFGLALTWGLVVLGWIDAAYFYLPDVISLPLLLLGLVETDLLYPDALAAHAVAAVLGYVSLAGINAAYRAWRHHDGIGQGDAKLLALTGAWLGWTVLPGVVAVAAVIGVLLALYWKLTRRAELTATLRLPFGVCLAPAIFAAYLAQAVGLISP